MNVSEDERKIAEASIDYLSIVGTGWWSGWSFPWASMIAGRAGRTAMAHQCLETFFNTFLLPNSFHTNVDYRSRGIVAAGPPIMTVEAGFAAAAAILEMLLQSRSGLIRIFPGIPTHWANAQFYSLRAEGAFLVSAKLADHRVQFVEIQSEAGVTCRVKNPFDVPCVLIDRSTGRSRRMRGDELKFATVRGGLYRLTPVGAKLAERDIAFSLPRRKPAECNWFGLQTYSRF